MIDVMHVQTLPKSTVLDFAFSLFSSSLNNTFCVSIAARPPDHPGKRDVPVRELFSCEKANAGDSRFIFSWARHHSLHSSLDDRCGHDS